MEPRKNNDEVLGFLDWPLENQNKRQQYDLRTSAAGMFFYFLFFYFLFLFPSISFDLRS